MRGSIPTPSNTSSWRCARSKHRDNFTFIIVNKCKNYLDNSNKCDQFPGIFFFFLVITWKVCDERIKELLICVGDMIPEIATQYPKRSSS
jgi:hypothetical protein